MENKYPYILNEYEVTGPAVICIPEANDGWKRCGEIMQRLTNYNFYVTTDGVGNIFLHLEPIQWAEFGSEHYMWVSSEEYEYISTTRAEDDLARAKRAAAQDVEEK